VYGDIVIVLVRKGGSGPGRTDPSIAKWPAVRLVAFPVSTPEVEASQPAGRSPLLPHPPSLSLFRCHAGPTRRACAPSTTDPAPSPPSKRFVWFGFRGKWCRGGVGRGGAMADEAAPRLLPVAADRDKDDRRRWAARCGFAVLGIMSTLLVYGVLQVGWVGLLVVFPPSLLPAP
jgi:hypothetical protein